MNIRQLSGILFIGTVAILIFYLMYFPRASDSFVDAGRCGVNMPSCPDPLKCMNGYCKKNAPPFYPPVSDLPVKPRRYPYVAN